MKKLLRIGLLIMLTLCGAQIIQAQITIQPTPQDAKPIPNDADKVLVDKSFIEDAERAFDEVIALRATVAQFVEKERAASERERANAKTLLDSLDTLINVKNQTISQYEMLTQFQQKIILFQQQVIDKMTEMLNKPKSAFQRFLKGVMEVIKAGVFIIIGRGLAGI